MTAAQVGIINHCVGKAKFAFKAEEIVVNGFETKQNREVREQSQLH